MAELHPLSLRACLCVLCGLPAAGKSTLAQTINALAVKQGWLSIVMHYDDLIPDYAFHIKVLDESPQEQTEWKLYRQSVLECIEQFLSKSQVWADPPNNRINLDFWRRCIHTLLEGRERLQGNQSCPLLFLLDDNFYYPSMRHEVYQLARKYSLGFCQVFLDCSVETCTSRNQKRSNPLPTGLILEMAKRLESPNPQKNSWEKNSIKLNNSDHLSDVDIQRLMELISYALSNPLVQVQEDNMEQKEADRLKCAVSLVHQADQACRRLVSEAMKRARDDKVPPERMRCLAGELNESKMRFLHNLRKQYVQELPTISGEDIDVHHVVKTAVDAFDREIKETLLRILKDDDIGM